MNFGLIFAGHGADPRKGLGLTGIFRKVGGPPRFFLISIALPGPLLTRQAELVRMGADKARDWISGNPTVCDSFDYFKHEVQVR